MDFRVSSYIEALDEERSGIAAKLREMIWQEVPEVLEKLSFRIPFYHYHGMFCYLNAIPAGIEIGFCRGKDLVFAYPQLIMGNRVMVAGLKIYSLKDLETLDTRNLLAGAAQWQVEAMLEKRRFVKKRR